MEQTRAAKLERRILALERAYAELEHAHNTMVEGITKMLDDNEEAWAALRDINLRLQFTMEHFQFRKSLKTGLMDGTGKPLEDIQQVTLYDIFLEKREQFAKDLEARIAAQTPVATESAPESHSPDAGGTAPQEPTRALNDTSAIDAALGLEREYPKAVH